MKPAALWLAAIAIAVMLAYVGPSELDAAERTSLTVSDSINAAKVASKE